MAVEETRGPYSCQPMTYNEIRYSELEAYKIYLMRHETPKTLIEVLDSYDDLNSSVTIFEQNRVRNNNTQSCIIRGGRGWRRSGEE